MTTKTKETDPAERIRLEAEKLGQSRATLDQARAGLADAVRYARSQGWSWADVGEALGITKQTAQERFGAPAERRPRPTT
jgi:hypothetical protein